MNLDSLCGINIDCLQVFNGRFLLAAAARDRVYMISLPRQSTATFLSTKDNSPVIRPSSQITGLIACSHRFTFQSDRPSVDDDQKWESIPYPPDRITGNSASIMLEVGSLILQ